MIHRRHRVPLEAKCSACRRAFKSQAGLSRHKCIAIRQLPVQEQPGSCKCPKCFRWLRSAGGLAVHKCQVENLSSFLLITSHLKLELLFLYAPWIRVCNAAISTAPIAASVLRVFIVTTVTVDRDSFSHIFNVCGRRPADIDRDKCRKL